jgi:hypothetical protein
MSDDATVPVKVSDLEVWAAHFELDGRANAAGQVKAYLPVPVPSIIGSVVRAQAGGSNVAHVFVLTIQDSTGSNRPYWYRTDNLLGGWGSNQLRNVTVLFDAGAEA